jgi:hypothetical protein
MYEIISEQITKLTREDQEKLFEILVENIELFEKIIPNSPLLAHAKGQITLTHPIATAFDSWKSKHQN